MSNSISIESKNQYKSLKLRLYPNQEQITLINKTFGCCRQIFNNRLQEKQEFYIYLSPKELVFSNSSSAFKISE